MELEDQVVLVDLAREMNELGAEQDSAWYWIQQGDYIDDWSEAFLFSKKERAIYDLTLEGDCSAFTVAEVDDMLPGHIEKGKKKYYLFVTKTKKTEYFRLPDHYICYVDISHDEYLHSEREDKSVDAYAKMWLYLKRAGLIE